MTVCIAAVCEDGKRVVVAADRMFTNPGVGVEFETDEKKIEKIAENCVGLAAGNSPFATEVLDGVRVHLNNNQAPWVTEVAQLVCQEYHEVRSRKADESIIMPMLGPDFMKFRRNGVPLPTYLEKQPNVFQQIAAMASQYNLGVDIVVVGIDTTGAHIFQISHPGTLFKLEKLGYATVGSGAIHALTKLTLGGQTRHRSLTDTLYSVYEAKKASEVAPGVGSATDLAVLDAEKGILDCKDSLVNVLEELRGGQANRSGPDLTRLTEACNAEWNRQ